MVGVLGIEPRASCSQNRRATAAPHPVINIELDDVAISVEPTIKIATITFYQKSWFLVLLLNQSNLSQSGKN